MSCTDNAKVSDSGYTNTCGNSQSQGSSGSSLSRNSNRSASSGYCGDPSNLGSSRSNEALPQPISKKKEKEHKKKKSKTLTAISGETEPVQIGVTQETETESYAIINSVTDQSLKKSEEVRTVELVDATDPGGHISDTNYTTTPDVDVGSQTNHLDNINPNVNDDFYAVVSLHDGLVVHSSASLQTSLGYPEDSWLGRSFIDFVHDKDKATFAEKITNSIHLPFGDRVEDMREVETSLFCMLQRSSSTQSNDKIQEIINEPSYVPFHLRLGFKKFRQHASDEVPSLMFLTITARPICSPYKAPEETIISSIFSTRHTASCHLSHVDDDVVQYFGYLPHEMCGRSLFDFYHPEDLPFVKDIYETIVKLEAGASFRSKPYRFAVQNGGYTVLETEWSSFRNPWEKKLEFIVGHHRVLRGPVNPDVFQSPDKAGRRNFFANMSEEVLKESQIIQDEIRTLLDEKIPLTTPRNVNAHNLTYQSKDLVSFMASLMHEVVKKSTPIEKTIEIMDTDERSLSEHDSVMLGEISPHHEYCDSKSSSETPPSYNQLNYNEKLERFFNSKPALTTTGYSTDDDNVNTAIQNNKQSSNNNLTSSMKNIASNHDSRGSGSDQNLSSGSNNQMSSASRDDTVNSNSNPMVSSDLLLPMLTETLLNKHNHDMEKLLVQKHKERQSSMKNSKINKVKVGMDISVEHDKIQSKTRGCKRRNSHEKEVEHFKKFKCNDTMRNREDTLVRTDHQTNADNSHMPINGINIWPQLTVTTAPHPAVVPIYYVPVPQIRDTIIRAPAPVTPISYVSYPAQSLAGVIYPPVATSTAATSILYAPSMMIDMPTLSNNDNTLKPSVITLLDKSNEYKRPASQTTSFKAEPGSLMAMSESSKKLLSPCGHFSSCLSIDGGCSSLVDLQASIENIEEINPQLESSMEDSSDSSFYGSFLNTSSGSSCNPDPMHIIETARRAPPAIPQKIVREKRTPPAKLDGPSMHHQARGIPPWMEGVEMTSELIYQYQMTPLVLSEVLKADMEALRHLTQPLLVNDQLEQLYLDLEGFGTKLILDDSNHLSEYENDGRLEVSPEHKRMRREMKNSKLAMIYEENAPLPSS